MSASSRKINTLAIMQPYFLPYIGYFQLMGAADAFVIYDDVNFIKQGWINRNNILVSGKRHMITLPLTGASSFKRINEIDISRRHKLLRTIEQAYARAPHFDAVIPLVRGILDHPDDNLARFLTNSLRSIAAYLGIGTRLLVSSEIDKDTALKAQDKVIHICRLLGAKRYINAIGGTELYDRESFSAAGLELHFLRSDEITYNQPGGGFVPNLSILDVMMFNSRGEIAAMLGRYELA